MAKFILQNDDFREEVFPDLSKELHLLKKLFAIGAARALLPLESIAAQNAIGEIERKSSIAKAKYYF